MAYYNRPDQFRSRQIEYTNSQGRIRILAEVIFSDTETEIHWNKAYAAAVSQFWGVNIVDMTEIQLMDAIHETGHMIARGELIEEAADEIQNALTQEISRRAEFAEARKAHIEKLDERVKSGIPTKLKQSQNEKLKK